MEKVGEMAVLRSRYIGMELTDGQMEGMFAGTTPVEAFRKLISEAATEDGEEEKKVIEIDDVSRVFVEAAATRDVCVELPDTDITKEEKAMASIQQT